MYAANHGHLDIVEYLIEQRGVDKHTDKVCMLTFDRTSFHSTVLGYVCISLPDQLERNMLLVAAENGHLVVVEYLIEKRSVVVEGREYVS